MLLRDFVILLAGLLTAQTSQPASPDLSATRQPRRTRMQPPLAATPHDQDRFRDERFVGIVARTYDMDETQQAAARAELQRVRDERRAALGPEAAEYDRLREEMSQIIRQGAGGPEEPPRRRGRMRQLRDNSRFQEIRDRLRELDDKIQLDRSQTIQHIEAILPADQVEKGRARRAERDETRRVRREQQTLNGQTPSSQPSPAAQDANGPATPPPAPPAVQPPPTPAPLPPARPLHPWEQYTRTFIAGHRLTDAQTNAALSILKDVRSRAAQVEKTRPNQLPAAEKQMFEELMRRLNALLTASQRAAKK